MKYATINPYNGETLKEFPFSSFPDLTISLQAFHQWRKLSVAERGKALRRVADLMAQRKEAFARLITLEMGKPYTESLYEITKTLSAFDFYIEKAPAYLQPLQVKTEAAESYVRFDPMGIIFSIMPWNFPFWQVFRFAVPTLIAGNVTLLKHAPNVPQCAAAMEQLFKDAGLPEGLFRNFYLSNEDAARLIADPRVHGLSFTGSDRTGSILAAQAGQHIKKCVMELGGNDPFLVLDDAELATTVAGAIKSRVINSGQACNGAKRFIVTAGIADSFTQRLIEAVNQLQVGDPMDNSTDVGPLARKDLAEKVKKQIADSVQQGALAHYGQKAPNADGYYVSPVVLTNVKPGMRAFEEEIFGPVWSVVRVKDEDEAVQMANQSVYGLAASVWTSDKARAARLVGELEAGSVFVNAVVKSNVHLPFGGFKRSGFGRELSEFGLKEFVNIKAVYIN